MGPWWFSRSGFGRFDLLTPPELGTCYFAEQPEGCFLEVFRDFAVTIPQSEVRLRHLAKIELGRPLRIADCMAENARAWGITAEIHSSPDYKKTQDWASAFFHAGFDGIRYFLRHDPAQRMVGFALFGPEGAPSGFPVASSGPIGKDLIRHVTDRFGLRVKPTP